MNRWCPALSAALRGSTLVISGGVGTDTFVGTRTRTGLTLVGFEL